MGQVFIVIRDKALDEVAAILNGAPGSFVTQFVPIDPRNPQGGGTKTITQVLDWQLVAQPSPSDKVDVLVRLELQ